MLNGYTLPSRIFAFAVKPVFLSSYRSFLFSESGG